MAKRYLFDERISIARDLMTGVGWLHRHGRNPSIGVSAESIWAGGGLYPWSSWDTAGTLTVVSSNAADTTMTLLIVGLNNDFDEISETVTLNGTTSVPTTLSYRRINRATITSSTEPAGNITIAKSAVTVAYIATGNNQTLLSQFTIPRGKRGYLIRAAFSSGKNVAMTISMFSRDFGKVFRIRDAADLYNSNTDSTLYIPTTFAAKSDIDFRASVDSGNGAASVQYDILIIDLPIAWVGPDGGPGS